VFQYRNLNNPDVYYNDNIIGLLQNYRAAYLRLANAYFVDQDYEKLGATLEKMEEVMPFEVIPAPDIRLPLQVGQYFHFANRPEEFMRLTEYAFNEEPDNPEVVGTYVTLLEREKRFDDAIGILEDWLLRNPGDQEALSKIESIKARQSDSTSN
jgi:cytochrome c-type biogenesis protein CcmH/NrfG